MNIILLDEPDSHIHRDIQNRLMSVLTKFKKDNQIFLTTHNEALIRSANVANLFHLEPKPEGDYKNIGTAHLQKIGSKFSGIYPTALRPVISSLGSTNGLDFINAVESDVLLFVEGEDDARVFDILFRQKLRPKKYAYWVLGGVSKVLENILHYKTVLSSVKNQKTLWEKSVLVMDRDFLNDAHLADLPALFQSRIGLKTCIADAYTFESTLLTDFNKFSQLLAKWLALKEPLIALQSLEPDLIGAYKKHAQAKNSLWKTDKFIEDTCQLYRNAREKLTVILDQKFVNANDIQLQTLVRAHIDSSINTGQFFKLMNKDDVQSIVNLVIAPSNIVFSIETDFIELMYLVDKSVWFDAWDFLNDI